MKNADSTPDESLLESLRARLQESERRLLRERDEKALLRRISESLELHTLLALLGEQLAAAGGSDGYLINLIDDARDHLVCEHIALPAGLTEIETTYRHFRFPLHVADVNVEAFQSQRPVVIEADGVDRCSDATRTRFARWGMSSLAVVPIFCGPSSFGTIMLFRTAGCVDDEMILCTQALAELFAKQVRNALHHRNLKEKEHALNAALGAQKQFLQFIAQVNSLTSSDTIHDMISREFLGRFPFDLVGVLTHEGEALVVRKLTSRGPQHAPVRQALERYFKHVSYRLDPVDGASPTVFLQNRHMFFPDGMKIMDLPMAEKDRGSLQRMITPRTILILPIRHNDEPVGVLWLVSLDRPVKVSEDDREFIDLLCSFIGTAMCNATLYSTVGEQKKQIEKLNRSLQEKVEELRTLASRDRLTGLANFGAFEAELSRRMAEYQRERKRAQHLSLVLLDVDHFKGFNDTYGHLAGNLVLQELARRLERTARTMDVPCRYGGEEFVVILPKCSLEGARIFGERLRALVEAEPFQIGKESVQVTVSVGCACFHPGESKSELIERADRALYRAKENGRNRVEIGLA